MHMPNDGDLAHEVIIGSIARDPRISGGVAWAGRYNERVDLQLREYLRRVVNGGHACVQKRDLLVQAPGEVEAVL
jgi:hypothetical protein